MDKYRKELIELIVAIETNDPRLIKTINRIKAGFNSHTDFQYREHLRRGEEAQNLREGIILTPKNGFVDKGGE